MTYTADPYLLTAMWRDITREGAVPRGAAKLTKVAESGWITMPALEDLISNLGLPALAGLPVRWLVETFGLATISRAYRPRSGENEAMMFDTLSAAELAFLVIELERAGFPVDPSPLVEQLRPSLKRQEMLTAVELDLWWYPSQRSKGLIVLDGYDGPVESVTVAKHTTALGYRVEAHLVGDKVLRIEARGKDRKRAKA